MEKRRFRRGLAASAVLAAVGAIALRHAPAAAASVPLGPGVVVGTVNPYEVKKGDALARIAAYHGVNPVRVVKPSADALKDGLESGETLFIDQRRVTPAFDPSVSGIVLNIPEAHVYLVEKGRLVTEYPVAVSTTDWKAPLGTTKVVSKRKNPTWYVPVSIQKEMAQKGQEVKTVVPPGPENPLGTRWIGFSDGTFGFHGTLVPTSIKRYASHGCVRFLRPHIEDLYDRVKVGTPVRVYYQPVMLAVDRKSVWLSLYPDNYKLGYDFKGAVRELAARAGVTDRLNWTAINQALKERDGILTDIGQPLAPESPLVVPEAEPVESAAPAP